MAGGHRDGGGGGAGPGSLPPAGGAVQAAARTGSLPAGPHQEVHSHHHRLQARLVLKIRMLGEAI